MLKTRRVALHGRDAGLIVELIELPALIADRHARVALQAVGAPLQGGVVSLAYERMADVLKLGEPALELLAPFVRTPSGAEPRLKDWRNFGRLQQVAVALHADFLVERELLDVPAALRNARIVKAMPDNAVTFCAPHIASVISSRLATYHELETVLSTEDAFNLIEVLNVDGIREWHTRKYIEENAA